MVPSVVREDDDWLRFTIAENVVEALKRLLPEKVLLFARRVELAAVIVMEPPSDTPEPFTVTDEFCSWLFPIVEVATTEPLALTASSVFVRFVIAKVVEVAFVKVVLVKALLPLKVLLLASNVDDAAVIVKVPPAVTFVLLIVASVPVRMFVPMDVVATT